MTYYSKTVRYNGGIIRRTPWGWQAEINRAPGRRPRGLVTRDTRRAGFHRTKRIREALPELRRILRSARG